MVQPNMWEALNAFHKSYNTIITAPFSKRWENWSTKKRNEDTFLILIKVFNLKKLSSN